MLIIPYDNKNKFVLKHRKISNARVKTVLVLDYGKYHYDSPQASQIVFL